jgi:hypothetical protein
MGPEDNEETMQQTNLVREQIYQRLLKQVQSEVDASMVVNIYPKGYFDKHGLHSVKVFNMAHIILITVSLNSTC